MTPEKKVFTGDLSRLAQIATQAESPSLIIVGSVATLHHTLGQ